MSRLDEIEMAFLDITGNVKGISDIRYLIERCRKLEAVAEAAKEFIPLVFRKTNECNKLDQALKALEEPKERFTGVEME